MSKAIPGIRGVPFRKIIGRENNYHGVWVIERLSCGHTKIVLAGESSGATKRRCYHSKCRKEGSI